MRSPGCWARPTARELGVRARLARQGSPGTDGRRRASDARPDRIRLQLSCARRRCQRDHRRRCGRCRARSKPFAPLTRSRGSSSSKTSGFRHASIPTALRAVRDLGARNGLTVDTTESAAAFTRPNLARYRAIVFLMTTGDVLNAEQQTAFERYFRTEADSRASTRLRTPSTAGRGTADCSARFRSHPQIQTATVRVERRNDPRPPASRRPGSARTSGTTSRATRAPPSVSSRRWTSRATRRAMALWAGTIRCLDARVPGRASLVHGWRPYGSRRAGSSSSAST